MAIAASLALSLRKKIAASDHKPASPLRQAGDGLVEFFLVTGLHDLKFQPEGTHPILCVPDLHLGDSRIAGIDSDGEHRRLGYELMQQLQSFLTDLHRDLCCTSHVAAGPRDIGDKAHFHRIAAGREDNRNRRRRFFCRKRCRRAGGRDDRNLTADEIGGQVGQPVVMALRPAVLDHDIPSLDEAHRVQAPSEFADKFRVALSRSGVKETDDRHRRLLRTRREWPGCGRAGDNFNEFAPPHRRPRGHHPGILPVQARAVSAPVMGVCPKRRRARLLDHLIGAGEYGRRNCEVQCFRGLEIDDDLKFGRILHRQVGGASTAFGSKADMCSPQVDVR